MTMLDHSIHQGSGLQRFAAQNTPRVLALVAHGDDALERHLLAGLCARLSAQGYPVALVDGTQDETGDQPGLAQLLDDSGWHSLRSPQDGSAWSTLPARRGLRRLCHQAGGTGLPVMELGQHLHHYSVIAVYASAQALSSLLLSSGIQPVITAAATPASLVSAYHALKQLLLIGKLQPTIVSMQSDSPQSRAPSPSAVGRSLQDCAMTFLDCPLDAMQIRMVDDTDSDDLERLALRLLEAGTPRAQREPLARGPWLRARAGLERRDSLERLAGGH